MNKSVHVLDYGAGSLGSILNMLKKAGFVCNVCRNASELEKAERLVVPGVGHFSFAMHRLVHCEMVEVLNYKVLQERIPVLGICLGMQMMTMKSEEGSCRGLGWIDAAVRKFRFEGATSPLKVPHMGWNTLNVVRESPLTSGMRDEPYQRFYFAHSYYVDQCREEDVLTTTDYGIRFVSSFQHGNIAGVQFHPEKSLRYGMALLARFGELQ
jgi:imidazole glycerol-phosphate synthase subunit HisH